MADRRLQVFHIVAKQLSFTKAAELLFMTQPAVTFQVKQLEEHFNTRLFERGYGKISLTPAGHLAFEYAERILKLSGEMDTRIGEMTGQISGHLLVGASTTIAEFVLPHILGEFKVVYPQVSTRLTVANSAKIVQKMADFELDIGLIETGPEESVVNCEVCCEDELVVICPPDHELAQQPFLTPAQIMGQHCVSREQGSGTREIVDKYFIDAGIAPDELNTVMELGSRETIKGVVESGLGISILSRCTVDKEVLLGRLIAIPLKPKLMRSFSMVFPKEKFRSRLLTTFADFAKSQMRESAWSSRPLTNLK